VQLSLHISGSIIVCEEFPKSISYIAVIGYLGLLFWLNTNRERMQTKAVLIAPAFICVILIIGYLMSTLSPQ
ncbi:MAG: hypothetical protein ABF329_09665, partial [Lentimonas sp.]